MDPHLIYATVTFLLMATHSTIAAVHYKKIVVIGGKAPPSGTFSYELHDTVVIDCLVLKSSESSLRNVSLKWQRNRSQSGIIDISSSTIQPHDNITFDQKLHLTISKENAGVYYCVANYAGNAESTKVEISIGMKGAWSKWGSWSACSGYCSNGLHQRRRTCTNPAPVNDGSQCNGSSTNSGLCTPSGCTGSWENWHPWEPCSDGHQLRYRTCAGGMCRGGSNTQSQECTMQPSLLIPPSTTSKKSVSDPSNLVITVAVSSALVGLLLCVAIIACWRRLHIEQRGTNQRSEDEEATQAILLSLTDSGPGISADNYPEDPALCRELDAVPPGVALFNAPGSFAEALQGVPPPPNPFFMSPGQETRFTYNNSNNRDGQAPEGSEQVNEDSSTDQPRRDLQSPEEEFAHLKEGITEDELPTAGNDGDVPPIDIL